MTRTGRLECGKKDRWYDTNLDPYERPQTTDPVPQTVEERNSRVNLMMSRAVKLNGAAKRARTPNMPTQAAKAATEAAEPRSVTAPLVATIDVRCGITPRRMPRLNTVKKGLALIMI